MSKQVVVLTDPNHDPLDAEVAEIKGKIAVCGIGLMGLIEGRAFCDFGKWAWVGKTPEGRPWASTQPRILHDREQARLRPLFENPALLPATDIS